MEGSKKFPSYISALSRYPQHFRIILNEWLEIRSLSDLNETYLFDLAKIVTPKIADRLLGRGVNIDIAKGPESQTIWHAVVEYHEWPERMLDWLLLHSSLPCYIPSSNGNTPLMLAIQLGKVTAAAWLSKHSNLEFPNPSNGLTAPELVAKCQTYESVLIFKDIMDNIAMDEERGRDLTKKMLRAIRDGLRAEERRFRIQKLRRDKGCKGLEQQHSQNYQEHLRVSQMYALEKFRIVGCIIGKHVNVIDWVA